MASAFDLITATYVTIYARAADPQGAAFWTQKLGFSSIAAASAPDTASLALADKLGPEFYAASQAVFDATYPASMLDSVFINDLYVNLGGLPADPEGAQFWLNRLSVLEGQNPGQVARSIVASEIAFTLQTYDPLATGDAAVRAETFRNKIVVSSSVALTGNSSFNPTSQSLSDPAYAGATNVLIGINNTDASRNVALAQVSAANAASDPSLMTGQDPVPVTYTLTTNIDTIDVPAGILANVVGEQNGGVTQTWNTGDTINGNGTTSISLVANGNPASIVDANNISSINVNLVAGTTLNSTEFTNVAQVAVTSGVAGTGLIVDQAALATTYAINRARATTVDLNSFVDPLTGSADAVNLAANGAGSAITAAGTFDLGGNAIETVNLATSGTNFVALADAAAVKTINITGNGTNAVGVGALLKTGVTINGGSGIDTIYATPAAGTSAATLTGVENVVVDFVNAGTFVSGVNWTGVTSVTADAASDENIAFSNLKAEVATVNLIADNTAAGDTVSIGYATGTASDITLNIGTKTAASEVIVGPTTITNNAGTVTINSVDSANSNEIWGLTDAKATALTVNSSAGLIFGNDVTFAKATSYTFNSTDGTTLELDALGQLNVGGTTNSAINTIALSATGVNSANTGSTVNVQVDDSTIAGKTNAVGAISIVTDANGTASFSMTEGVAGTVEIASIDASASAGAATIDVSDLLNGTTVATGAGTATVFLTQGADTFSAGAGAVAVSTTGGADTITLGAAADTVTFDTFEASTVASFAAGASADKAVVDVSAWQFLRDSGGVVVAGGATPVFLTAAAGAAINYTDVATDANVIVLTGVIADNAALQLNLIDHMTVTNGAIIDGDNVLVAYYNGANTQLVSVEVQVTGADVDGAVVQGGVELTGINTTALVTGNVGFIA